ncbi:MAG: hypothetical protein NVV73_18960 [Cellvibrionaceae bacterium]|nr:hypothetical protein [Cellvibrionaceae bacterium]
MNDALIRALLIFVAIITVLTGAAQMLISGFMLQLIGADFSPVAQHWFTTVGMFMVVTGAMFAQTLWTRSKERAVPLWIGVQKLAAAALVAWAFAKGQANALVLLVAAFDFVSAALAFLFAYRIHQ